MQPTIEKKARHTRSALGCYLYAVIDCPTEGSLGLSGLDGGAVYAISDGSFAVAVSDVPNTKIRPERRRLAAHHEVLRQLSTRHTLLPMSFGLIADGAPAIRDILEQNRPAFEEQTERVADKMEMGLRVVFDVPNIFEFLIDIGADLRSLRDHLYRHGREPSHDDKIELGRRFSQLLEAERAAKPRKS